MAATVGEPRETTTLPVPPDFPVRWEAPEDARLFWSRNRMHFPDPLTPLDYRFLREYPRAIGRAAQTYELPIRLRTRHINTYLYAAAVPAAGPVEALAAQARRAQTNLEAAMARLDQLWGAELLPEVRRHLAEWEAVDLPRLSVPALLAHLDETQTRWEQLCDIHFIAWFPACLAISMFDDLYRELFGGQSAHDAYGLLRGVDNLTVASDRALWRLSRRALAVPEVREALRTRAEADVRAALDASAAGRRFLGELGAFLETYGRRGDVVAPFARPYWIEDPLPVIRNLREYLAEPSRDLEAETAALAGERERLVAEARARLSGQAPSTRERFEFLLRAAQAGTAISEDHAFWIDSYAAYEVRRVLLEFGRRLAAADAIDGPDDVFYLALDEVRDTAAAPGRVDRRRLVAARRAEVAFFRTITPPPALGTPPASVSPPDDPMGRALARFWGEPPEPTAAAHIIRGNAGSPGVARGPARVVRSLAEAGKLQRGDVLVAETTAPPWTPLFPTLAAIVTDTGGVLSHCAVVAREYRIPAVVGTGNGTALVRDGQPLEVDGGAGVVRLL